MASRLVYGHPCRLFTIAPDHPMAPLRAIVSSHGGGLIQDDQVDLDIQVDAQASLMVTSAANTQVMKNTCGRPSNFNLTASVASSGRFIWWPEPVVLHSQARYTQSLSFDCEPDARLACLDWFQSGRSDSGETYEFFSYRSEVNITLGGESKLYDVFGCEPGLDMPQAPSTLGNYHSVATLYLHGYSQSALDVLRSRVKTLLPMADDLVRLGPLPQRRDLPGPRVWGITTEVAGVAIFRWFAPRRQDLQGMLHDVQGCLLSK